MNIIISHDKTVRITQQEIADSYKIQDFVFYIAKTLSFSDIYLNLNKNLNTYTLLLELAGSIKNYNIYNVAFTQPVSLSKREYELEVGLDMELISIGSFMLDSINVNMPIEMITRFAILRDSDNPFGLNDMHEPVDIKDRTILISNSQNVLLAEDNISQSITFRMPRFYDGIDLASKSLFLDYIDIDSKELFNLPLKYINTDIYLNNDNTTEYMTIEWAVPYEITKTAGIVKFAISAVDLNTLTTDNLTGDQRQYIWQTEEANLIIKPNLHKRNEIPQNNIQSTGFEEIAKEIDSLNTWVEEYEASDIGNLDTIIDSEITLNGGTAPIEEV